MQIKTYELKNNKISMKVNTLGCAIMTLLVPDKDGNLRDVVFGLENPEDYTKRHGYFGVVCGRVANRINAGKFTLNGKEYQLETQNGGHCHGGPNGFDKKIWTVLDATENKITYEYQSPDGEAGYPGTLTARVTYTLTPHNSLKIDHHTTTDSATICSLTNHTFFNLEGHNAANIYDHQLTLSANKLTAVDEKLIPTGEFFDVTGTAFDFQTAKPIGRDLHGLTPGYDHNFFCDNGKPLTAEVYAPASGIRMKMTTDSPGVQFYSGNFLNGGLVGKNGVAYQKHSGFCLETQYYPDAINHPHFPQPIITKDAPQTYSTEYTFSTGIGLQR